MRKFTISPAKNILDLNGDRFISNGAVFFNYLLNSLETRTDYTIRTAQPGAYTPVTGVSFPTFQAPTIWKSERYVAEQLDEMLRLGFNTIRVGVEPCCQNTVSYTDLSDGVTYPSDVVMLDLIIEMASNRGIYTVLTLANWRCTQAQNDTYLQFLVNRYKEGGVKENAWVGINPQNEINCAGGDPHGTCNSATTWITDCAHYVSTIRTAGWTGLIFLCPPNSGWQISLIATQFAANTTLNNDGAIVMEVHSYRQNDTFNATRIATETSNYLNYQNTFAIIIGEHGPTTDGVRYDGDLDVSVPTANPTIWAAMIAYETAFLPWVAAQITTGNINGLWIHDYRDHPLVSGSIIHSGNTMFRLDGGITQFGSLVKTQFLGSLTPPTGGGGGGGGGGGTWISVFTAACNAEGSIDFNSSNYNVRMVLPASSMTGTSATQMRLTLKSTPAHGPKISALYVGQQAATGDIYDFATTPTQVLFGGSPALSMAAGGIEYLSDAITITVDPTKAYVFSYAFNGAGSYSSYNSMTGANMALKTSAGASVSTVNVTGYTPNANLWAFVSKIEVQ